MVLTLRCFVRISEQTAIFALYVINCFVFYNRSGKCLQRGTDWFLIYVFERLGSSSFSWPLCAVSRTRGAQLGKIHRDKILTVSWSVIFPSEKIAFCLVYVSVYVNTHAHTRPAGSAYKRVIFSNGITFWLTNSKGWRSSVTVNFYVILLHNFSAHKD